MKRAEKAERIASQLAELYPEPPIPLDHTDSFTLLVAVLLSAQTTDKKVNEVTPALFADAPTPAAMAALEVEEIRNHIRQLGLAPQKAKNLSKLSRMLVDRGGDVPQTFEELEALPGVGHKTASVVMAQAFGHPAFPVDTHIHRLAARWGLSNGKNVETTERDLKKLFPRSAWNDLHLQIIYFGREHCPARFHDLTTCPICSWASTKKRQREEARENLALRQRRSGRRRTGARAGSG
ncbi:MAG: endonuclease III [Acidobacteriota bacterium]